MNKPPRKYCSLRELTEKWECSESYIYDLVRDSQLNLYVYLRSNITKNYCDYLLSKIQALEILSGDEIRQFTQKDEEGNLCDVTIHKSAILFSLAEIEAIQNCPEPSVSFPSQGKRKKQIENILSAVDQLNLKPLSIPDGGKSKVKEICEQNKSLFNGKTSFNKAWQAAVEEELVRMENHHIYSRR